MSKRPPAILPVISVIIISVIFSTCGRFAGDSKENQAGKRMPAMVRIAPASKTTISRKLDLTGSVEPYRVARLASPAEGPVVNVRVREGDGVKAGHPLISIGRKQGIDALTASLREEVKKERDNLQGTRQLVESGALPHEQLDLAVAAYEKCLVALPDRWDVLKKMGDCYAAKGQMEAARAAYEAVKNGLAKKTAGGG